MARTTGPLPSPWLTRREVLPVVFLLPLPGPHACRPTPAGVGYILGDWVKRPRSAAGLKDGVALFAAILVLAGGGFTVAVRARARHLGSHFRIER